MMWKIIFSVILLSSRTLAEDMEVKEMESRADDAALEGSVDDVATENSVDDIDLEGRFSGGSNVQFVPGYVATIVPLGLVNQASRSCGGALINASLILTSASCMFGSNAAIVSAGYRTDNPDAAGEAGQITYMSQIFYHPSFSRNTDWNDIAIVRVYPPFNLTNTVYPIQLPKGGNVKEDALAKASGGLRWFSFGNYNATSMPDTMQTITVTFMSTKACTSYYKVKPFWYALPKTMMCLLPSMTTGICPGDPGSPIIAVDAKTNKPYLAGLAGRDTDRLCPVNATAVNHNTPDLFIRIDPFFNWIYAMGGPKSS